MKGSVQIQRLWVQNLVRLTSRVRMTVFHLCKLDLQLLQHVDMVLNGMEINTVPCKPDFMYNCVWTNVQFLHCPPVVPLNMIQCKV